ncbi:hypothetical protein H5R88_07145 [Limosilactobacillus sp. WF-MT5-A]|uniref:phage tail tube assembly chaperone n=1 Tax=Limosilactobacillus agrestis TaxID=2759748 RepID=UPI0015FCEDE5|nr:phage tail tube assembly chaperone [Limosilactobacillus agrestis]MBB1099879.1 hypothetical protein [Limosilactobacillus agrestis]MCD7120793.1 hypothetical protein [Limosilactobacillus agrestis]MCD7126073.1 hypothetical protein [Limosilactobacillus agrestis]
MKIDTTPLGIGKQSIEVNGSWGEIDQADELMISLYSIDAAGDNIVAGLKAERMLMKQAMEFFRNIFHLDKKQTDQIYNKVDSQVMNLYITYVCGLIKGASEQSFAKFKESLKGENETDPKGELEKVNE